MAKMERRCTKNAGKGDKRLAAIGLTHRMAKSRNRASMLPGIFIPKLDCLTSSRIRSTTTPAMLFSLPNNKLKQVTNTKQKATVRMTFRR